MNRPQLCLSSRTDQLLRWQEAFPHGRIISDERQLETLVTPAAIVWIHLDCLTQKNLTQICALLLSSQPAPKLIAISQVPEPGIALECLKLGISGYCHALSAPDHLLQVNQVVSNGGYWLGEELVQRLVGTLEKQTLPGNGLHQNNPLAQLSPREQQVALQVRKGAANKEIALSLFISERTVKAHLGSIFQKLGIRDRLQLVLLLQDHS